MDESTQQSDTITNTSSPSRSFRSILLVSLGLFAVAGLTAVLFALSSSDTSETSEVGSNTPDAIEENVPERLYDLEQTLLSLGGLFQEQSSIFDRNVRVYVFDSTERATFAAFHEPSQTLIVNTQGETAYINFADDDVMKEYRDDILIRVDLASGAKTELYRNQVTPDAYATFWHGSLQFSPEGKYVLMRHCGWRCYGEYLLLDTNSGTDFFANIEESFAPDRIVWSKDESKVSFLHWDPMGAYAALQGLYIMDLSEQPAKPILAIPYDSLNPLLQLYSHFWYSFEGDTLLFDPELYCNSDVYFECQVDQPASPTYRFDIDRGALESIASST
jgi:hypothetical protein